ncbi:AlpA family phage regulatory protein [Methylovulum psychrotolerans]|uniref:helix-turn-helix transcriptional regulator n=1 Tax=Methylovulum psychrotolerans TaxID=1704499 RepID=UPI001BFF6E87|nr:AlpA family phage regulatory protein [Methylovulum psychrotolerans]MBT9097657.1 AlpA family phage regulatory protein [Methylovulum psychrotolerans]
MQIVRPKAVCQTLGISMATFWRLVKDEKLATVKISKRATGVMQSELDRFLTDIQGAGGAV